MSKIITRSQHFVEIDDVEYEVRLEPDHHVEHRKLEDGRMVIGYLMNDGDCANPLEDCDGVGKIHSFSRRHDNSVNPSEAESLLDEHKTMAVMLSYFEHGLCRWGVAGTLSGMPDFQWDGVKYAGIWVPDDECKIHIHTEAAKSFGVEIRVAQIAACSIDPAHARPWSLEILVGKRKRVVATTDNWSKASLAAAAIARDKTSKVRWDAAIHAAARKCAENACEQYTSWCNGDCYGVVVVTCNQDGSMIDSDECWGYIGSEYAEQTLKENMAAAK